MLMPFSRPSSTTTILMLYESSSNTNIEFQTTNGGRGQDHLSAFLQEGDVVVYQTGTWNVDGVTVGDGDDIEFQYCLLDSLQIVWTHNCEHGVLRGIELVECHNHHPNPNTNTNTNCCLIMTDEFVEFGPEQLVAKLPVKDDDDDNDDDDDMEGTNHSTTTIFLDTTVSIHEMDWQNPTIS